MKNRKILDSCNSHGILFKRTGFKIFAPDILFAAYSPRRCCSELTLGRLCYGDIYAKSFYMLGKIYEQQGNPAKATEHYENFLDLWKDADPGIAEVEDSKSRLNKLKTS